jgi:hypothetical protein
MRWAFGNRVRLALVASTDRRAFEVAVEVLRISRVKPG